MPNERSSALDQHLPRKCTHISAHCMVAQQGRTHKRGQEGVRICVGLDVGYDFEGPSPKECRARRSSNALCALLHPPPFMHCREPRAARKGPAYLQMKGQHLGASSYRGGRVMAER